MAALVGVVNHQFFTDDGELAAGYRLYTYLPGTTNHQNVYTDSGALTPHTYQTDGGGGQYIQLSARGEVAGNLYASVSVDLCLKTTAGVTVWTKKAIPQGDATLAELADEDGAGLIGLAPDEDFTEE